LVATADDTLATTCEVGGIGMFHGPKAFFLSANGGRTWQRRSEALIPGGPDLQVFPRLT
jgi:hypothetical protein